MSQDGRLLAVACTVRGNSFSDQELVRLLDADRGAELRAFANLPGLTACCLSADRKLLAACGTNGLRLWDTATGTLLAEWGGHRGPVTCVAFSPDGGTLVSAALDGTLLVWDVAALSARPLKKELTKSDLETLWNQLASADAELTFQAMQRLADHSQQTAGLFRAKLKPAVSAPKERITKLVAALDDTRPITREAATKELTQLAELAEPALLACLSANPSLEQRRRLSCCWPG
jgi:hypothetical protein